VMSIDEMTNISKANREKLAEHRRALHPAVGAYQGRVYLRRRLDAGKPHPPQ
jgi:hypothetical protein